MSESEVLLKEENKIIVLPERCPICGVETIKADAIEDGKTGERSLWYDCTCGVWFQDKFPEGLEAYDEKYIANLSEGKSAKTRYLYP
jgi:hypothetical protein